MAAINIAEEHVALLKKGVDVWNEWRRENPDVRPDLNEANLWKADLREVDLRRADLKRADLRRADLSGASLNWSDLEEAKLRKAILVGSHLHGANLRRANLYKANLMRADLSKVLTLHKGENQRKANLNRAKLTRAFLRGANLREVDLTESDLRGADLTPAMLVKADFTNADLTGCRIYGVSAWGLKLDGTTQQNLVITAPDEPEITVDNIEVAQFVYLLLHNQKIRDVIDTTTSKAVLILGRFTSERKAVLDAIREELRKHDYLPILFDFDAPATRDITETVSLLARMARFIIADLTNPSSIPMELQAIVPHLAVPVQPLLEGSAQPFAMFRDLLKHDWVLQPYRYEGLDPLLASLADKVIAPAEAKVKALEEKRRMIEAELTKPQ